MEKILIGLFLILSNSILGQRSSYLPTSTTNQIINHTYYTLSYSKQNKQAEWVIYLLTRENVQNTRSLRSDDFRVDPLITSASASLEDYKNSGYDRGHLCPAADMSFDTKAMSESFYLSNMSPQNPSFNRGIWKSLEELVRSWAIQEDSLYVVTGPVFVDNKGKIGPDSVTIPGFYYKVICDPTGEKKMIGFLLPNEKGASKVLSDYSFSVDYIEEVTNIDFFHNLSDSLEFKLERNIDFKLWKF